MRLLGTRVFVMACTLVLGLAAPLALADSEQARPKGSRERPRSTREAPRTEVATGTEVSLTLDRKYVRQGDRVQVTVNIDRGANVGHVPFHLNYDPTVLRFEGGEEGGFLKADGQGTVFLASPASTGNAVVVGLSRLGRQVGVAGKGELCTLEFTAIDRGDAKLTFARATVRDADNRALEAEFTTTPLVVR